MIVAFYEIPDDCCGAADVGGYLFNSLCDAFSCHAGSPRSLGWQATFVSSVAIVETAIQMNVK